MVTKVANGRQTEHSPKSEDMTMSQSQPDPKAERPPPSYSPETLWQMALNDLRFQMTKATFNNWLAGSSILTSASSPVFLVVVVRNLYAWEWLTYRLRPVVAHTIVTIAGEKASFCFVPRTIRSNDDSTQRPLTRIQFL
jgi:hypothetical protein